MSAFSQIYRHDVIVHIKALPDGIVHLTVYDHPHFPIESKRTVVAVDVQFHTGCATATGIREGMKEERPTHSCRLECRMDIQFLEMEERTAFRLHRDIACRNTVFLGQKKDMPFPKLALQA